MRSSRPFFRTRHLGKKTLLVSYTGSYQLLDDDSYRAFMMGKDSELEKELTMKGLLVEDVTAEQNKICQSKMQIAQGTSLHIMVLSLRCNQRCIYCHAASRPVSSQGLDMSEETAEAVVDFALQSPSRAITIEFQGGEPLLNFPVLKHTVEYAKERNKELGKDLKFSVVTNLSLMDDEILDFMIAQGVGLCTSLDGPKVLHDKNRPMVGGSSYDHAASWIMKMIARGVDLHALMSTTRYSLPHAKDIVDVYKEHGLRRVWARPLNNLGLAAGSYSSIGYTPQEYLAFWKELVDHAMASGGILEVSSWVMLRKILFGKNPLFVDLMSPCGAAISQMAYNHNGDVYSCDEARMLDDDLFRLGNVFEDTYHEVMSSPHVSSLVKASVNESLLCDSCPYQPYCGVCPVCTYATTGTLVPKLATDSRCQILKGQFDHIFSKILSDPERVQALKASMPERI